MKKIYLNFKELEVQDNVIKDIPIRINEIIQNYNNIIDSIDKNIRDRRNINYDITLISKQLKDNENRLQGFHLFLLNTMLQYNDSELKIQKLFNKYNDYMFNNKSIIMNKNESNIEELLKIKYNINLENNINQILDMFPEIKERIYFVPYTSIGKIYEIQKFLNKEGYTTDLTGKLDAQTRNSLLLYSNLQSTGLNNIDEITLPYDDHVNYDTPNILHADGFGNKGDNYYLCNLGWEDYFDIYTVSSEVRYSKSIQMDDIDLSGYMGVSALDAEFKTDNIGSKNIYSNVSGEGEILTAHVNGGIKLGASGYGIGGEAIAAGASGNIKTTTSIFGVNISFTGRGYAGAFGGGLKAMYEYKNGRRELNFGVKLAALFGIGGDISVSW